MTKQEQIDEIEDIISGSWNTKSAAQNLYNAGYRKVLLETEDGKMVDCVQYAPWELIKGYTEREVNKARKETAKKIFKMLISELESNKFLYGKRIIMEVDVENLAKQCGVDIKE